MDFSLLRHESSQFDAIRLLWSVSAKPTIGADESDANEQLATLWLAANEN